MKFTRSKLLLISTCTASALTGLFFSGYNYHASAEAGTVSINASTGGTGTFAGAVSGSTGTFASGLTVSAGGASIGGGINNNSGGITNAGTLAATTGTFSGNITGVEIYSNSWLRNNNVNTGLYNTATATHLYSHGATGWTLTGGSTYPQLMFRDTQAGTIRGYLYSDVNGFGLLNSAGSWSVRTAPGSDTIYMPGSVGIGNTPSYKLDVTGDIRSTTTMRANGGTYFCGGDDACLNDVNVANTVAIYGAQASTRGTLRLGNGSHDISGFNNNVGVATLDPVTNWNISGTSSPFDQLSLTDTTSGGTTYVHRKAGAIIEFYNGTNGAYAGAINTTGAYYNGSDRRLKKDIQTIPSVLDKVLKLRPVTYHSTNQTLSDPLNVGFIAQEVENIFPEAVVENQTTSGYKALTYQYLFTYGIGAIQEQQKIINDLGKQLNDQKNKIENLEKIILSK